MITSILFNSPFPPIYIISSWIVPSRQCRVTYLRMFQTGELPLILRLSLWVALIQVCMPLVWYPRIPFSSVPFSHIWTDFTTSVASLHILLYECFPCYKIIVKWLQSDSFTPTYAFTLGIENRYCIHTN